MAYQSNVLNEGARRVLSFDEMAGITSSPQYTRTSNPTQQATHQRIATPNVQPGISTATRGKGNDQPPSSNASFSGSDVAHPAKCVCQICTCGRHHCPEDVQLPKPEDPRHYATTYAGNYTPHPVIVSPGRSGYRPRQEAVHAHPSADQYNTNYGNDYVAHPAERRASASPRGSGGDNFVHASRPDQYCTTTSTSFVPHDVGKWSPRRATRDVEVSPSRPFDGTTTYHQDFIPKQNYNPRVHHSHESHASNKPFDANTTYHDNFGQVSVVVPVRVRPTAQISHAPESRDFQSEAHAQFVGRPGDRCPAQGLRPTSGARKGEHVYYSPSRHQGRMVYK